MYSTELYGSTTANTAADVLKVYDSNPPREYKWDWVRLTEEGSIQVQLYSHFTTGIKRGVREFLTITIRTRELNNYKESFNDRMGLVGVATMWDRLWLQPTRSWEHIMESCGTICIRHTLIAFNWWQVLALAMGNTSLQEILKDLQRKGWLLYIVYTNSSQ
jgi:hypothetical protein